MRSNLPGPSQAWGNDIERRIKALESNYSSIAGSTNALNKTVNNSVLSRALSGVGYTYTRNTRVDLKTVAPAGIATKTLLVNIPMYWMNKGTTASIVMNGFFYAGKGSPSGLTTSNDTGVWMTLGIKGASGTQERVYPVGVSKVKGVDCFLSSVAFAITADYDTFETSSLQLSIHGVSGYPGLINTSMSGSFAELSATVTLL